MQKASEFVGLKNELGKGIAVSVHKEEIPC